MYRFTDNGQTNGGQQVIRKTYSLGSGELKPTSLLSAKEWTIGKKIFTYHTNQIMVEFTNISRSRNMSIIEYFLTSVFFGM